MSYETFLLSNQDSVQAIESSLRSLTYILPGRFKDAAFVSEAVYSGLGLLGAYHDSILAKGLYLKQHNLTQNASYFNQFSQNMIGNSTVYHQACKILSLLQYTEALVEMISIKYNNRRKWRWIVALELLKFVCRIFVFFKSGRRLLLHSFLPERETVPEASDNIVNITKNMYSKDEPSEDVKKSNLFSGRYSAKVLQCTEQIMTNGDNAISEYLRIKSISPRPVFPQKLLRPLSNAESWTEILYIARPLIYVLALSKYGQNRWTPWFISLCLEMIASWSSIRTLWSDPPREWTILESQERLRRFYLLFLYIIRGPMYTNYTKCRILRFCDQLSQVPLVSLFSGILRDYQPLWENNYYYTQ